MIAPVKRPSCQRSRPAWHAAFLAMWPRIVQYAQRAFARLDPEARQEAVQEVVAGSLVAFVRLVERDKADLAYPTVLARYAIRQLRAGRRVGSRLRSGEVLAPHVQHKKGFRVERLDHFDKQEGRWIESLVPDERQPVPDQAAFRLDFPRWLATLSKRDRRIAEALAVGGLTGEVARRFRVTPARISQLRRRLHRSWNEFHGEPAAACRPSSAR